MSAFTPIPVIICGKIASHQHAVPEALKPEYTVRGTFPSVQSLAAALPALLEAPEGKPTMIFMGGGFDRAEFEAAYAIPGASSIPWARPVRTKPGNEHMIATGNAPPAEVVAALARKTLDEHIDTLKANEGAGEIWYY